MTMSSEENARTKSDAPDGELINLILEKEIEEHSRTEEELRDTRSFLENLLETLPSVIIVASRNGVISHWNKAAEKFTGIPQGKAVGEDIWETIPLLKEHKKNYEKALEGSATEDMSPVKYLRGDEERAAALSIYPLRFGGEEGAVFKLEDITEILKKDEYVRQSQKMDTVGSLASGLAHDFNNVIGALEATISSIKYSMDRAASMGEFKESVTEDFEVLKDSLKHGAEMVEQLRSLGRKKEQPFSKADLAEIIRKTVKICRKTFPDCIETKAVMNTREKACIMAYPTQMEQMLLNLCVNASHAMTDMRKEGERHGGVMTVSLSRAEGPNSDDWVVKVADTGVGMDKETAKKIFDPFFTTKEKSKGTGLGLSMVYNIIQNHKGRIWVESEPGKGSVFSVSLPAAPEEDKTATGKADDKTP